eukprot:143705-Rhodomonas_salina.1
MAPSGRLCRDRHRLDGDRVSEAVAVGVDHEGALALAHDLEVCVDEHVGAVRGVALVVGGHEVEPVGEVAEDLGHE